VMQANSLNERMHLLVEEYSTSGRLDNITQVMSLHTQYLESFLRSQFYMLRMDGPLPLPYRHYIAIMDPVPSTSWPLSPPISRPSTPPVAGPFFSVPKPPSSRAVAAVVPTTLLQEPQVVLDSEFKGELREDLPVLTPQASVVTHWDRGALGAEADGSAQEEEDDPLFRSYPNLVYDPAAARHQCSYLINMHVDEFLKTGGIPEWLNGLEYVPQRLKNLNEINKLLAHRPWLVSKEHIQQLVKTGENNWSLPELVHAVVLLAHYHALASFVFGSGINPERDLDTSNGYRLISVNNFCVCDLANDNNIENASLTSNNFEISDSLSELEALMDRMKRLQEEEEEEASQEEMDTRFEKEKTESLLVVTEGIPACLLQFSSFCFIQFPGVSIKNKT
ncbi:hypothetical protein JD844_033402, partial [Phrynosoma platyrhinos]